MVNPFSTSQLGIYKLGYEVQVRHWHIVTLPYPNWNQLEHGATSSKIHPIRDYSSNNQGIGSWFFGTLMTKSIGIISSIFYSYSIALSFCGWGCWEKWVEQKIDFWTFGTKTLLWSKSFMAKPRTQQSYMFLPPPLKKPYFGLENNYT
jgi:hypothetical protein